MNATGPWAFLGFMLMNGDDLLCFFGLGIYDDCWIYHRNISGFIEDSYSTGVAWINWGFDGDITSRYDLFMVAVLP